MKKLILILCMILLVTPFVIAADWSNADNYKVFDEVGKYGKIEIWDTATPILFQPEDRKLVEYELLENTDQCLIDCYAEGTVILYEDRKLFSSLEFKGSFGDSVNLKESRILLWTTEEYEVEVEDYKETCEDIYDDKNKTTYEVCTEEVVGTHKEIRTDSLWKEYNFEKLDASEYKWRIEGKKDIYQRVDWVGTSFGKELTEWAWWNNDWAKKRAVSITGNNGDLVYMNLTFANFSSAQVDWDDIRFINSSESGEFGYFKQNYTDSNSAQYKVNTTGDTSFFIYYENGVASSTSDIEDIYGTKLLILWALDGTSTSAVNLVDHTKYNATIDGTVMQGMDGVLGSSFNFSENSRALVAGDPNIVDIDDSAFSINMWVRTVAPTIQGSPIRLRQTTAITTLFVNANFRFGFRGTLKMYEIDVDYAGDWLDQWKMLTMVYNGSEKGGITHYKTYVDGVVDNTGEAMVTSGGARTTNTIGDKDEDYIGFADEITVYNRTLSAGEVYSYYNFTEPVFTLGVEEENVIVTSVQSFPADNSKTTDNTVGIGCNFTAASETIANVSVLVYDDEDNLDYTDIETGLSLVSYNKTWITSILDDDIYLWSCLGETATLSNHTGNRTFTVDTTPPVIAIVIPENISYTSNQSVLNYTHSDNNNGSCWYSVNGGVDNSSTSAAGTNFTDVLSIEGSNTWDLFCNDSLGTESNVSVTFSQDSLFPVIDFGAGTQNNGVNVTVNWIFADVTVTEANEQNITFLLGNSTAEFSRLTFTNATRNFNWTSLEDDIYNYNVTVCDTSNLCNSTETRQITIDTIFPTLSVSSPIGNQGTYFTGRNLSLDWAVSDVHLGACFYDYEGSNTTVTCGNNQTNLTVTDSTQSSLAFYVNDTFGHLTREAISWSYTFTEDDVGFTANVSETSSQTFELNMTTSLNVLSITSNLNYGGTKYLSTSTCSGQNCTIINTIDIPLIIADASQTNDFFWEISIFDGALSVNTNTTTRTQNVSAINLENCNATWVVKALNFTVYDEQNLTRIEPFEFNGAFDFWLGGGSVFKNNSFSINNSEVNLCLSPNDTMKLDATIDYDEQGNLSLSQYTNRFYYFENKSIDNTLEHIFMYLLRTSSSTSFILKVQDENLLPVADALIEIYRFYPGENLFKLVQIAKTDDNGKSIGFFETETVDYKFIIKKNGEVLLETGSQKVVPEVSPFTLTFSTGEDLGAPWSPHEDVSSLTSSLTWDVNVGIVSFIYVDTSDSFTSSRLFVERSSLTNSSAAIIICNNISTLSSATVTCGVGNTSGGYVASGYITRDSESLIEQITFQIETFSSVAGLLGLFLGWFLILIAAFMFRFNEIAGIWAITVTIFLVNILGLIKFGTVFVTATLGVAIVLTWLMNR